MSRSEETPHTAGSGRLTRRSFLAEGGSALIAAGALHQALSGHRRPWWRPAHPFVQPTQSEMDALAVLGRTTMRMPGSLPHPSLAMGTDTIPEIEHVVVLMMENHSYDNFFGMLGRGKGEHPRGDGFTLAADGLPTATNPYPNGQLQRAFKMPTTCQLDSHPSQEWTASHTQFDDGRNDGFVRCPISHGTTSINGPVGMGYFTAEHLPLTYALAETFPIGDRWFCSVMTDTDPNRRYLIAATSQGMTGDIGDPVATSLLSVPAKNGTIFSHLEAAGITWADYNSTGIAGATMNLYPTPDGPFFKTNGPNISKFFSDAKAGTLPQFSLLDPNYSTQSQENPQNITVGEGFLGRVIDALRDSPKWRQTVLILTYDEHGGYYDHVPPPKALAPDDFPPKVDSGEKTYDGFARYGFRVPSMVIGPYAKRNHVSHKVYDHTSILAFAEHKWNLPHMTKRDANAHNLLDFLDMPALKAGKPTFPELPKLVPAGDDAARLACSKNGLGHAGTIPPKNAGPTKLKLRSARVSHHKKGIVVEVVSQGGKTPDVQVVLSRSGGKALAHHALGLVGPSGKSAVLKVHHGLPSAGDYEVVLEADGREVATKKIKVA
jgi:phospholipase C